MVTTIKELETADTESPSSSTLSKTQESNLDYLNLEGSYNLNLDKQEEVLYKDALGNEIFQGVVRNSNSGDKNSYIVFDYGIELGEIPVRKNYKDKTPIEIIEDVITNYTNLTFVNLSSVTTTRTIPLYPTGNKHAIEIIDDMHKILKTTHSVDNDKNFNLEIEGFEDNSIVLQVGVNCDLSDKETGWESSTDLLCDGITVNGDTKRYEEIEFVSGTGTETTFDLANPFTDIKIEYPIGTILEPEIEGVKTGDYKINKETAEIIFNVAPANGTDNIKVYYVYQLPVDFNIAGTGDNPHHVTINEKYLKEVEDCKLYATKYKLKFGNPIRSCKLIYNDITKSNLFKANQRIKVIDSFHIVDKSTIDDFFIIKSVTREFGDGIARLIIEVGDSTTFSFDKDREIETGIKDINQQITTADIFNEGISTLDDNELEIEYEVTVTTYYGNLPSNVLVSDTDRTSTNEADYPSGNDFVSIDEADYNALFFQFGATYATDESGNVLTTNSEDKIILNI